MQYGLSRLDYEVPDVVLPDHLRETMRLVQGETTDYPKSTEAASGELRTRGYDCTADKLNKLVRSGVIPRTASDQPSRFPRWTEEIIDKAADHFEQEGQYTPWVVMCSVHGFTYAEYKRALREAFGEVVAKYGQGVFSVLAINPDAMHYELHTHPPRGDDPATVRFSLCEDMQKKLEAELGPGR